MKRILVSVLILLQVYHKGASSPPRCFCVAVVGALMNDFLFLFFFLAGTTNVMFIQVHSLIHLLLSLGLDNCEHVHYK